MSNGTPLQLALVYLRASDPTLSARQRNAIAHDLLALIRDEHCAGIGAAYGVLRSRVSPATMSGYADVLLAQRRRAIDAGA